MAYGELKVDTITFTDGGTDTSVAVSGLVLNPTFSGNITSTGTISGDIILGGTTVSGATVSGGDGIFVSGVFTDQIFGATITGNTVKATSITGVNIIGTTSVSGATITGGTIVGTTTVSGATVTGTTFKATTITGGTIVGTTTVSGATVTGNTIQGTTITGGTVVGTTTVSGATVTGTAGNFTNITGGESTFTSNVTLNAQSDLRFADSDSSNWVAFQAPATVASDVTWTLPDADGSSGQVLSTDGLGTLSWATAGGGGGGELQQDSQGNLYAGDSAWQSYTSLTNGHCIAIGETAGQNTTTSNESVFLGRHAGEDVTTGDGNIGIGPDCFNNTLGVTGSYNVAIAGFLGGGRKLTSGPNNVFIGSRTGENMTTGSANVILGDNAGRSSTTATHCVFMGRQAGQSSNGTRNICIGSQAGTSAAGTDNTIIGSTAQYNTAMTGTNNTVIGYNAFASTTSISNEITLGDSNIATLRCNQTTITSLSDGRDKINVAQLGEGLDFIARLKPVKFEWQTRDGNIKDGTYEAGFIAQDLQQAQQDADAEYLGLVMDSNPDRLEASYGKLVPVLVRAIQELKAEIDTLKAHAVS